VHERVLGLHRQSARTPKEQEMLRHEIESTDAAIDRLAYELSPTGMIYGLTEEEIRIVEYE